jgi:hypothetical protein
MLSNDRSGTAGGSRGLLIGIIGKVCLITTTKTFRATRSRVQGFPHPASISPRLCTANDEFLTGPRKFQDVNGWLGHSAAAPQYSPCWGTAALSRIIHEGVGRNEQLAMLPELRSLTKRRMAHNVLERV